MSDALFLVSSRGRHLCAYHDDPATGRRTWQWYPYEGSQPSYWLTAAQLEELRQHGNPWYVEHLEVTPVANGPWLGYWRHAGRAISLHLSRKVVEFTFREPPEGPFTLSITAPDDLEAWWAWQTPRDDRPMLCYSHKLLLGTAIGDLSTATFLEARGRGRLLPVKVTLEGANTEVRHG